MTLVTELYDKRTYVVSGFDDDDQVSTLTVESAWLTKKDVRNMIWYTDSDDPERQLELAEQHRQVVRRAIRPVEP